MQIEIIVIDSIRHFSSDHPFLVEQAVFGYLALTQDQMDRLEDDVRRTLIPKSKVMVCQTGGTA
jgi:hypothetical protein